MPNAGATVRYGFHATPIGLAFVATSDRGIARLELLDEEGDEAALSINRLRQAQPGSPLVEDPEATNPIQERIRAYLTEGRSLADLPLDLRGTPFQLQVWEALKAIPFGSTRTYGELAGGLGVPGGSRAVGAACGANPVALVVPCHRVLRSGGGLGGYRWGLDRKRALLARERA